MLAIPGPVARSSAPQLSTTEHGWLTVRSLEPAQFPERRCTVGSPVVKAAATMTRNHDKAVRRKKSRSADQREWNVAMGRTSSAWEYLTDEQRLLWNVAAKTWRMSGQRYFVKINARRLRDGLELLIEPPKPVRYDSKRVLKRLVITNRRGRIVLKLEVSPMPGARYTVWGSRPCNQGVSWCPNCPRLGPLPAPAGRWSDITALYFRKHDDYIMAHELPVVGKRVYIRVRQERDEGPTLYEEIRAVVPAPEGEQE